VLRWRSYLEQPAYDALVTRLRLRSTARLFKSRVILTRELL